MEYLPDPQIGFDAQHFLPFILLIILCGCATGVTAGLLGVGGGFIVVPTLYHIFNYFGFDHGASLHVAVGTSLATIIVTGSVSARAHRKRGALEASLVRAWAIPLVAGVVMGGLLAGALSERILAVVFAVGISFAAIRLLTGKDEFKAIATPGRTTQIALPAGIGAMATMMGIGGGSFAVPALTFLGRPIHMAVGTSASFGPLIALPGAIVFVATGWGEDMRPPFSLGYVNLLAFAAIIPFSAACAPLGVRLAHRLPQAALRRVFGLFCLVVAADFIQKSFSF